jgi:hypothetical protein
MFVGDGTLVLARNYGESVEYKGPPPRLDVGVQQGNTGDTGVYCKVLPGPSLLVSVKKGTEDTQGSCRLRSSSGDSFEFPLVVRSAYREK